MSRPPVHMIGFKPFRLRNGKDVITRCGVHALVDGALADGVYLMTNEAGGDFRGTTRETTATCKKCRNLIDKGTLHGRRIQAHPSRSARPVTARHAAGK